MKTITRERRYKILWVSEHDVLDLWHRHAFSILTLPVLEGVPEDCEVQTVRHDALRRAFGFLLYHDSFDVVPEGQSPPATDVGWTYVLFRRDDTATACEEPVYVRADG